MNCPEASCSSAECHAWDTLLSSYRQADDASLNVWVLAPVAFVVALVAMVRALSKGGRKSRVPEVANRPESGPEAGAASDGLGAEPASESGETSDESASEHDSEGEAI